MEENKFKVLTTKPGRLNKYIKYYNNSNNNGISWCINGKPTDNVCNVLSNCVGWACGRFNHIYSEITGYKGIRYPNFCCNAENFIEVAINYGLSVGMTPRAGAIMCWQKGATLNGSDGAGHVAIVEEVKSPTQITTSESGYNSFDFANKVRIKGDGNWGASSAYTFRGFIYNPAVTSDNDESTVEKVEENSSSISTSTCNQSNGRDESKNQILVKVYNLRIRQSPGLSETCTVIGFAKQDYYYTYTDTKCVDGYTWYKIGDCSWIAHSTWSTVFPAVKKTTFNIGDEVKLAAGAPVYGQERTFSSWVYNTTLFVRSINGNRVVVSIYKTGAVTGSVDIKYLIKV